LLRFTACPVSVQRVAALMITFGWKDHKTLIISLLRCLIHYLLKFDHAMPDINKYYSVFFKFIDVNMYTRFYKLYCYFKICLTMSHFDSRFKKNANCLVGMHVPVNRSLVNRSLNEINYLIYLKFCVSIFILHRV